MLGHEQVINSPTRTCSSAGISSELVADPQLEASATLGTTEGDIGNFSEAYTYVVQLGGTVPIDLYL